MKVNLILVFVFSYFNFAYAIGNNLECEYKCCIEYYLFHPDGIHKTKSGQKRIYLNDTLFVEFMFDRGRRLMGKTDYQIGNADTFKVIDNVTYFLYQGVFYRFFSEHDFNLQIPMSRFVSLPEQNLFIGTNVYYPIKKVQTDTANIFIYKLVGYGNLGSISISQPELRFYLIPEIGFVKTEYYKSGKIMNHLIELRKSEGCEEFLDRVFNREKE